MGEEYYWDEIKGIGKLYTDIELVVGFEPVLFVCTVENDTNNKYLMMTYDSCNGIYVIRKIDNKELLDMLENKVTMEETFRNGTSIIKTYIDDSDDMLYEIFESTEFDANLLPRKGEFLDLKSRHILSYIEKLKQEVARSRYNMYNSITKCSSLVYNFQQINNQNTSIVCFFEVSSNLLAKPKNETRWDISNSQFTVNQYSLNKNQWIGTNTLRANFEGYEDYRDYNVNNIISEGERLIECVV